jgi:hypothetical protein
MISSCNSPNTKPYEVYPGVKCWFCDEHGKNEKLWTEQTEKMKHVIRELQLSKQTMDDLFPEKDPRRKDAMIIASMFRSLGIVEQEYINSKSRPSKPSKKPAVK